MESQENAAASTGIRTRMEKFLNEGVSAILKVVGVGYLAGISSDICSELGAARIGNAVTLVGRLEIIAIATPFFVKILDMGVELIG